MEKVANNKVIIPCPAEGRKLFMDDDSSYGETDREGQCMVQFLEKRKCTQCGGESKQMLQFLFLG